MPVEDRCIRSCAHHPAAGRIPGRQESELSKTLAGADVPALVRPLDRKIMKENGKKIRVLECIRQGKIGGGESHLLNLVEYLDKDRFDPIVLSFTEGPMIDRLQQMGIGTDVIYTERPFDVTKWGKVKELLKERRGGGGHARGTPAGPPHPLGGQGADIQ